MERPQPVVVRYIIAADRNNPDAVRAHLYAQMDDGDLWPMCGYGWNRSDGQGFSILRGNGSARGECAICQRRADANLPPIMDGFPHPTRWI